MARQRAARRLGLLGVALLLTPIAWAASLTVSSGPLGAGADDGAPCDTDGVTLGWVLDGSNIKSVTVSGIAAACSGGEVRVTVKKNATGTPVQGAGSQTISSTAATVVLDPKPAQIDSAYVGVVVAGP